MASPSLKEIFLSHKHYVSDKWESYLEIYQEEFSKLRNRQDIKLLEIGVQNGGSLEIWGKFFPNAKLIVGCDINENCKNLHFSSEKIKIVIGDSCSTSTIEKIKEHYKTFDLIIDDGAHTAHNIICNFLNLFPLLSNEGLYVIEDLHCSYWSNFNPHVGKVSSIEFLKILVDMTNIDFWNEDFEERIRRKFMKFMTALAIDFKFSKFKDLTKNLNSVTFYNSLCIIKANDYTKNRLGRRIIVGQEAIVEKSLLQERGN